MSRTCSPSACMWPSSRSWSPDPSSGHSNCCPRSNGAGRPPMRPTCGRPATLIITGLFKKIVLADGLAAVVRSEVLESRYARVSVAAARRLCLCHPDLRRLLWLLVHRPGCLPAVRDRADAELRAALPVDEHHPVLADLAHLAVHLASRLPLRPSRWQPKREVEDVPQPPADHAAGRPVARSRLDLRGLGCGPRPHAGDPPGHRRLRTAGSPGAATMAGTCGGWSGTFHLVGLAWVFFRAIRLRRRASTSRASSRFTDVAADGDLGLLAAAVLVGVFMVALFSLDWVDRSRATIQPLQRWGAIRIGVAFGLMAVAICLGRRDT